MRLIYITVAWALGISLARSLPGVEAVYWLAICAAAASIAALLRRHRLRWILALTAAFAAGGARLSVMPRSSEIAAYNGASGTITGVVVAEPRVRDDRVQLRVEVESIFVNSADMAVNGLALVESGRFSDVRYGDRIRATGALETPAVWDRFSYADYLGRQGIFSMMRHAGLEVLESGQGQPFAAALLALKDVMRRVIATALPEPQAGLLTGILLGDERGISPGLADDFARVGASHVIAISGFNMVVVSAIVIRILSSLFAGNRLIVACGAVAVIAVYSLLVGASPGILRAALMSSLLVIGSQLKRRTFVPTSLAFATLLLSAGDPHVLLDIGFQLSFCAVLGLGLFVEPLSRIFRRLLELMLPARLAAISDSVLKEPLIVSIAAQISTLPLVIFYFDRLSLVALPVNLLIVPAQSALLLLGLSAVMLYVFIPALGSILFWADYVFLSWTISVVRSFAALDFAELVLQLDGRLIQVFYILMIGGAMIHAARPPMWRRFVSVLSRNAVFSSTVSGACIAFILMLAMLASRPDGRLNVWLLDVGHSNAALLQTPGGAQIMIDGGRFPSRLLTAIGDRLPFYDREIEILVITHPDEWDIAALNSLLNRYAVGAALYHGQPNRGEVFQEISAALKESRTAVVEARAGYALEFSDGVRIEVLHPQSRPTITDKLGDGALVLRVHYGSVSVLLTSDLSAAGQREMLARGASPVASIMQIPQHGAARALDRRFLERAQPQVALLQSDIANRRGDPDPDTMAQLEGLHLFRTDQIGHIHLSIDGRSVRVFH